MSKISLTVQQQSILEAFVRGRTNPQWLVTRAMILLKLSSGLSIRQTAKHLHLSRNTVRAWSRKWQSEEKNLLAIEDNNDFSLSNHIKVLLSDFSRCGRPATFCPEEIVQIVSLACESPTKFGRPITHWTQRELADEVIKQGIVKSISARSVGRFLKGVQSATSSQPLLASS